jgi:hypothetical protein
MHMSKPITMMRLSIEISAICEIIVGWLSSEVQVGISKRMEKHDRICSTLIPIKEG